jgi:hypothetical protein
VAKKFFAGLVLLLFPILVHAQAVAPVTQKRASLDVGGYFSYGQTDYGQNHAFGPGFYGDFDYRLMGGNFGVGIEGEARFLNFNTTGSLYEQNFLGGPRVTYHGWNHYIPYAKFLAGGSRFRYPSIIYGSGPVKIYNYTTFAYGGGLDIPISNKWTIRPVDFEYQHWTFPPTGLTPWVYSAGVSYTLF